MENNETFVTEPVAENTEQTVEESPKLYTQADFDAKLDEVLGKKIARKEAKIRKEYDREYGELMGILESGTGKKGVREVTDTLGKFYESKGIKIEKKPDYSDKDIEVLAKNEADDIIRGGYEEVVEEIDRMTDLGYENLTARDKAVFKALGAYRENAERGNELAKIGVTEDVYNSNEFKSFAAKFTKDTPITDIYDIYTKMQPKKEIRTAGSMKQSHGDKGVKDYYSPEEIDRLTEDDLKDPKVWEAVRRSMTGG